MVLMGHTEAERAKQVIGGPVPEINLPALDGTDRNLGIFLEGKKGIVVVFWSETCSHCILSLIHISEPTRPY